MEGSSGCLFFHIRNPERIDRAGLPAGGHGVDRQDFIGPGKEMQRIQKGGPHLGKAVSLCHSPDRDALRGGRSARDDGFHLMGSRYRAPHRNRLHRLQLFSVFRDEVSFEGYYGSGG
jgi:hypothetical protein